LLAVAKKNYFVSIDRVFLVFYRWYERFLEIVVPVLNQRIFVINFVCKAKESKTAITIQ